MLAGRPQEAVGNGSPRWMTVAPRERGHRTRPTGRLTPIQSPDLERRSTRSTPGHFGGTPRRLNARSSASRARPPASGTRWPPADHRSRAPACLPLACVSMSYDMFVQGFDGGDAAPMPSAAFDVFRPHVDRTQPEHHLWHVRTPDDGEADIYADLTGLAIHGDRGCRESRWPWGTRLLSGRGVRPRSPLTACPSLLGKLHRTLLKFRLFPHLFLLPAGADRDQRPDDALRTALPQGSTHPYGR